MKGEDKEYDAVIARIRAAVAEGKMTREQAAGRIEAYKKRIGRRSEADEEDLPR